MTVGDQLRAEWDRLIDDYSVVMTQVCIGQKQWSQLRSEVDHDMSLGFTEGTHTFRGLPIRRTDDLDGWRIDTRKERK